MIKLPPPPIDFVEVLQRTAQAAHVLVTAGLIEDELEKLLKLAGRKLDKDTTGRVFKFRGPLGDFSGKIDIAYMFKLIEEPFWRDLHVIRQIRNSFAHTTQHLDFDANRIATNCRRLSNWRKGENQACFFEKAAECANAIRHKSSTLMMAKALEEPSIQQDSE
jgi:DNA-binding MltR family transcriptional regulator